jgi:hypothetical protein
MTARIKHPIYRSWEAMKRRCNRESDKSFKNYGGRGITYCSGWESFDGFLLDMGTSWFEGVQIERINVNGNYEPGNCKWASRIEQANNKRGTELVKFLGQTKTLRRHCEDAGVPYKMVWKRINLHGMTVEDAISKPISKTREETAQRIKSAARVIEYNGQKYSLPELESIAGIKKGTIHHRMKYLGWDVKRAVETPLKQWRGPDLSPYVNGSGK